MRLLLGCAAIAASVAFSAEGPSMATGKVELKSPGVLAFGPAGILFVGDTVSATLTAIDTGDKTPNKNAGQIELKAINEKIAAVLGTAADQISIADVAVNPVSRRVYLSVARGRGAQAVSLIMTTDASGKISELSLDNVKHAKVALVDAPSAEAKNARGQSPRMETITDIGYAEGRVFVAGLSNEEFASSLRSFPYPFKAADKGAGIEIFHGAHGRFETNAPVRTFVPYKVANTPHLLAAYTCTPLVTIPLSELKPGNKVKGKTIAELGNRNRPLDMIVYTKGGKDFILMANSSRGVMKLPTANLDGYSAIVAQTEKQGVPYETIAELKDVQQLDKYDDKSAILLQTTGGSMDLRTIALP
ncbi:MAG: hypothetical protein FJW32_13665 [Acidobacteria bacterium]|nr:hypothetical protein [Acidobacteriota bacterium]